MKEKLSHLMGYSFVKIDAGLDEDNNPALKVFFTSQYQELEAYLAHLGILTIRQTTEAQLFYICLGLPC